LTIESSPRLAYLGGLSLFLGNLRQLTLTYGLAGMQIDKLTTNLQPMVSNNIQYSTNPGPAAITYYKQLNIGQCVSLSYTFYRKKNKSAKATSSGKNSVTPSAVPPKATSTGTGATGIGANKPTTGQ
ncbi:MAG TPA: hypothetical protein VF411_05760, partial [Bacteroidia bacterium]